MSDLRFHIEPFIPKEAPESTWRSFFALKEAVHWSIHPDPDDIPVPPDALKQFILNADPHHSYQRWIAWNDARSELAGFAVFAGHSPGSPGYETNKHLGHMRIEVKPEYRRQGLGTALARLAVEHAVREKIQTIQDHSECDAGQAFCEAMGGTLAIVGAANVLKMDRVDWAMIEQWAEDGPKRAEGATLELFETVPEADLEAYCTIYTETMNQQPMGEMEGEMITTPERRRGDEERAAQNNVEWLTMISREPNGEISGLTEIVKIGEESHRVHQQLTGVRDSYRGRGLGKWLKAAMLLHVRETYPDVKMIFTGNADENAPMLSINNRMGFERYITGREYKFKIDELKRRVSA